MSKRRSDLDPEETREWRDALDSVASRDGVQRARFLVEELAKRIWSLGGQVPLVGTPYVNTIPTHLQPSYPGDEPLERRIAALVRWNALVTVMRANQTLQGLGGHIATYQSAATLYEVAFHHFFRASDEDGEGDLVFFQAHCAPGIYARSFLEGRLSEEQLSNYRREVDGGGLSAYPHPRLMPGFWQFPTASLGLAPIMAIYQARFMRYLQGRELAEERDRKVWAFLGDGEMDEPEALGALNVAAREGLDNLIFVVNCNLQRLDGPVRGNGKIIQELEASFRGAGWNVVKVLWGSEWDPLFARDHQGVLRQRLEELLDGEFQAFAGRDGAYMRARVFGDAPELREMVAELSDEDLLRLRRGGHDPRKVFAAYAAAVAHEGQPTVVLAQTVKGYGLGETGEGQNVSHQQKKLGIAELAHFRDRFEIPVTDEQLADLPFFKPPDHSPEIQYLRARRETLGGAFPSGRQRAPRLDVPELEAFEPLLRGSGGRELSTTTGFVKALGVLARHESTSDRIVPIVADEARTFGMEGFFRQLGIYAPRGQLYEPVDAGTLLYYREERDGKILQEGVTEAGALSSWIAAGTAHTHHGVTMMPFFIFYSMFGFQRFGDLAWAAADLEARGFLLGATSGRTTLSGEGLQHQDGHSHLLASTFPNCVAYDPAFVYELAVILQDGMRRMFGEGDSVFYYITLSNENQPELPIPEGTEEGIRKGMYLLREFGSSGARDEGRPIVQLLGSGAILHEVLAAAEVLEQDFGVVSDVWSVTSFTELRREASQVERWNRLHPQAPRRVPYVAALLTGRLGPVVAASDYMKLYADQIRPYIPRPYCPLGTDGFGRSDTRQRLRAFFEVDRYSVATAALAVLAEEGRIERSVVSEAIHRFGLDPEKPAPDSV